MFNQDFMVINSQPGIIAGMLIKGIVFLLILAIAFHFINTWAKKKHVIPRNLAIAFTFYALAPLFSLSDILFGLQNIVRDNSLLGMSLAFLASAGGNVLYFWFITAVFFQEGNELENRKQKLITIGSLQIGSAITALVLRLLGINAFVFSVIYMISALYIFLMLASKCTSLHRKIDEAEFKRRLKLMSRSSWIMVAVLVLFSVDSFFTEPTWYSLTGWILMIFASYFIKNSY